MTMLPVLNYREILLKSGGYIWHVFFFFFFFFFFCKYGTLTKTGIFIFEVDFGNICEFSRKKRELL